MDNEETQFEEVEDEIDRQAAVELLREINTEEELDDQPEINQVEEELRIFDDQV
jgi:hypothetical protein